MKEQQVSNYSFLSGYWYIHAIQFVKNDWKMAKCVESPSAVTIFIFKRYTNTVILDVWWNIITNSAMLCIPLSFTFVTVYDVPTHFSIFPQFFVLRVLSLCVKIFDFAKEQLSGAQFKSLTIFERHSCKNHWLTKRWIEYLKPALAHLLWHFFWWIIASPKIRF